MDPHFQVDLDCYAVLQVTPDADAEVVAAAYKRLAFKFHPDRNPDPEAAARMRDVNVAYDVLRDPERRRQYDAHRRLTQVLSQHAESVRERFRQGCSPAAVVDLLVQSGIDQETAAAAVEILAADRAGAGNPVGQDPRTTDGRASLWRYLTNVEENFNSAMLVFWLRHRSWLGPLKAIGVLVCLWLAWSGCYGDNQVSRDNLTVRHTSDITKSEAESASFELSWSSFGRGNKGTWSVDLRKDRDRYEVHLFYDEDPGDNAYFAQRCYDLGNAVSLEAFARRPVDVHVKSPRGKTFRVYPFRPYPWVMSEFSVRWDAGILTHDCLVSNNTGADLHDVAATITFHSGDGRAFDVSKQWPMWKSGETMKINVSASRYTEVVILGRASRASTVLFHSRPQMTPIIIKCGWP